MCSGAHELAASFKYTPLFVSMNPVLIIAIEICVAVVLPTVWRSSGCTVDLSVCRRQGKHRIKIQCIAAAHARTHARTHARKHAPKFRGRDVALSVDNRQPQSRHSTTNTLFTIMVKHIILIHTRNGNYIQFK